jgi:hypothetical protein
MTLRSRVMTRFCMTSTMYLTPGHTLGTISTLVPVRDGGRMHLAAEWAAPGSISSIRGHASRPM